MENSQEEEIIRQIGEQLNRLMREGKCPFCLLLLPEDPESWNRIEAVGSVRAQIDGIDCCVSCMLAATFFEDEERDAMVRKVKGR